jgi:hypothetical protein
MTTKMVYSKNAAGEFVCPTCGETKARQNTMFYHMKKHAGLLNHVCTICSKGFIQKSGLTQHMTQTHPEDDGLWNCPCCDHSCRMRTNMIIHIARKHGEAIPAIIGSGPCDCSGCKREFSSATAYFYHAYQCFGVKEEPVFSTGNGNVQTP